MVRSEAWRAGRRAAKAAERAAKDAGRQARKPKFHRVPGEAEIIGSAVRNCRRCRTKIELYRSTL